MSSSTIGRPGMHSIGVTRVSHAGALAMGGYSTSIVVGEDCALNIYTWVALISYGYQTILKGRAVPQEEDDIKIPSSTYYPAEMKTYRSELGSKSHPSLSLVAFGGFGTTFYVENMLL